MANSYSIEAILKASGAEDFSKAFNNASKQVEGLTGAAKQSSGGIKSMASSIGKIAAGIGVTKLVAAGFNAIRNSVGQAVSRVDTLNQFPKMMEAMGFSAEESEESIGKLSDGIQGLPTTLDGVAATAQQIAILTGDIEGATDTTLALNNAFLASGSDSADASRGLQQYTQMLSKGEVDMQSWRTLQETMGVALNDTAKAFGFAGESAQNDLYDALKDGSITFDEFNDKIIELSNETGGFADRALIASEGIATSMQNIKTAIATGVANAIQEVNDAMVAGGFGSISDNLDKVKVAVQNAFAAMVERIGPFIGRLQELYDLIVNSTAFQTLRDLLQIVLDKFNEVKQSFLESEALEQAKQLFKDIGQAILDIDFVQLAKDIQNFIEKWSPLIAGIMGALAAFKVITGAIALYKNTMGLVTTAVKIGGAAIGFLTSPIGLAVAAIGIIIAIGVLLYKNWDTIKAKARELGNRISQIWDNIKSWTSEKWNAVKTSISNAVNNARTAVVNKFNEIKNNIRNSVTSAWNTVRSKFQDIVNAIRNSLDDAKRWVDNKLSAIKSAFENIDLFAAGKAIIQGFLRGLKSAFEGVKNFVGGIGTWIKNNKGPISYDKRLLIDAGNAIMDGLDKGLQDNFRNVQRTVGGMAGAIENSFGSPSLDVNGSVARSNAQVNSAIRHEMGSVNTGRMESLLERIANGQTIVLDSGELVGATYPQYDREGGNRTQLTERWGRA